MPAGFRFVDGRWYWRPTNQAARIVWNRISPDTSSAPAGQSEEEALAWYKKTVAKSIEVQITRGFGRGTIGMPARSLTAKNNKSKAAIQAAEQHKLESLLLRSETTGGWIYFIRAGATNRMKIGYTSNVDTLWQRVSTLQTGAADSLDLLDRFPGNKTLERLCHHVFCHLRIHGEWFRNEGLILRIRMRARAIGLRAALDEFVRT